MTSGFGYEIVYILDSRPILNGTPTDLSSRWWLNDIFFFVKLIRVRRSIKAKFRNQTKNFHTFFSCFIHTRETVSRLIIFPRRLRELWMSEWVTEEENWILFFVYLLMTWVYFTNLCCFFCIYLIYFGAELFIGSRTSATCPRSSSMKSFCYL